MNRNVVLNLVLAATSGLADNIWGGTVLVAYLYQLADGRNMWVGATTAVQGLSSLLTAFPSGYFADRYSRTAVIRVGAVVQLVFIAGMFVAALYRLGSVETQFYVFCASLGLNGFAGGIISGPAQALLADSLPTGFREKYYNYTFVLYLLASCVGPILCIVLFQRWGDTWSADELRTLLLIGVSLEVLSVAAMLLFRDGAALGEESEAVGEALLSVVSDDEADEADATAPDARRGGRLTPRAIPYIIFGCDLLISLASGCTVKFFPLFFKNDCGFSPSAVQAIYVVVPVAMAACSTVGTRLSKKWGSVQAVLGLRTCGLCFFAAMIALYHYGQSRWLVVATYVARTAVMNATYPIEESILMDHVPKRERAKWKSLQAVSSFGWCGSAFLGGILADRYSYTFAFIITISMQAMATVCYTLLLPLVRTGGLSSS